MTIQNCHNCGQIIGNLQEPFSFQSNVVCKACKILLEEESQAIEAIQSNAESEIPIVEILPQAVDTKHDATVTPIPQYGQEKSYGGIRRAGYFFGMLGVSVLSVIISAAAQGEPGIEFFGLIIAYVLTFVLVVNRLHNIGKSGWLSLLIFIPIANLFVGIPCLMFQEGYQDTKKLDTTGKIIAGLFIGLVVLMILVIFIAVIGS